MTDSKQGPFGDTFDAMSLPNYEHRARAIQAAKAKLPENQPFMEEYAADYAVVDYDEASADMVDHMRNDGGLAPELPHSQQRAKKIQDKFINKK
ncbi:hypothetical protein D2Q93_07045 [Alicyclobacillaceae bacterium I2511]|nr:hypothetical protein D2Q93_07045 [Alicyclobacillaceae bacterium I2511]